jgi:hypothetical protein
MRKNETELALIEIFLWSDCMDESPVSTIEPKEFYGLVKRASIFIKDSFVRQKKTQACGRDCIRCTKEVINRIKKRE